MVKHGKTGTKIFHVWANLKQKCYNPNNHKYKNYGARGIVVCKEWLDNFLPFYEWANTNGYREGLTLDRINVNGNYEPSNCRWTDMKTQQNNKTVNLNVTINGEMKTARQWEEEYQLSYGTIARRLNLGWKEEDMLNEPNKSSNKSGVRGIAWNKTNKVWHVRVAVDGKVTSIGSSANLDKAKEILQKHRNKLINQLQQEVK